MNQASSAPVHGHPCENILLDFDSWQFDPQAEYFYFCQNESIDGVEYDQRLMRRMFDKVKEKTGPDTIIVSDMSSALGSRDLSREELWQDFGVIIAGAQKNFGTSGLTFLVVREDVIDKVK